MPLEGAVTEEMVGEVRSMVMVVAELVEGGPTLVPETELALSCNVRIPAVQLVTEIV